AGVVAKPGLPRRRDERRRAVVNHYTGPSRAPDDTLPRARSRRPLSLRAIGVQSAGTIERSRSAAAAKPGQPPNAASHTPEASLPPSPETPRSDAPGRNTPHRQRL